MKTEVCRGFNYDSLLKFSVYILFVFFQRCFSLSETEIESFLNHLSSCVHSNGSSATVTEITRYLQSSILSTRRHNTLELITWPVPYTHTHTHTHTPPAIYSALPPLTLYIHTGVHTYINFIKVSRYLAKS